MTISEYVSKQSTVTIPQIQRDLGLPYNTVRQTMRMLEIAKAVKYIGGLSYAVLITEIRDGEIMSAESRFKNIVNRDVAEHGSCAVDWDIFEIPLLFRVLEWVCQRRTVSVSDLQRAFNISFNSAGRTFCLFQSCGYIDGGMTRGYVLLKQAEFEKKFGKLRADLIRDE